MFGRKILFLAAGYVAGNVVSSVYSSSKKKTQKKQGKEDMKMMIENFLATQKNMIADIENKYLSDENKQKLSEKKRDFAKYSQKYIKQGEKLLSEIKNNEKLQSTGDKTQRAAGGVLNFLQKSFGKVADVSSSASEGLVKVEKQIGKK